MKGYTHTMATSKNTTAQDAAAITDPFAMTPGTTAGNKPAGVNVKLKVKETAEPAATPAAEVKTQFSATFLYGPQVIQEALSTAIGYFIDGMPISEGRTAECALSTVILGDFTKYFMYLKSLANLLDIAGKSDRDALRLCVLVKKAIQSGLNSPTCLALFAHLQTGGCAYPAQFARQFEDECLDAQDNAGANHANIVAGREVFENFYSEFAAKLAAQSAR